jgi:hypothetical protein
MSKKNKTILMDEELLFPRISQEQQEKAEQQIVEEQKVIDYDVHEYPVEVLSQKYREGIIDDKNELFVPPYQRKFVWDLKKQSKFIESLMLGLPIPYLFTADNQGRLEIVDGSQRIRTLDAFLHNEFALESLEKLDKLNGFKFKDLHITRQRRFKLRTIRMISLTENANIDVRKAMFERINTTPALLTDMEIRRGKYEGSFMSFIEECASNGTFQQLCPISDALAKREERTEMILRYFAYSENYESFVHEVKEFLDAFVEQKQDNFIIGNMEADFINMLNFVEKFFPNGFRKTPDAKSTPRVRFEAISVGVHLALKEKPDLVPQGIEKWLNSDDFKKHTTTDAANNKNKVIGRIEYVRNKLLNK